MSVQYGMTVENLNEIARKAEGKRNGVYTFRAVAYLVEDGRAQFFACRGDIYQRYSGFLTKIGTYRWGFGTDDKRALREGLKVGQRA